MDSRISFVLYRVSASSFQMHKRRYVKMTYDVTFGDPFVSSSIHRSSDMIEHRHVNEAREWRMPCPVSSTVRKTRFLESFSFIRHMCSILRNMIREDKAALVTETIIFLCLTVLSSPTPSPLFFLRPGFMFIRLYLSLSLAAQHSHQMYAIYLPVSLPVFIRVYL